MHTRHIPEGFYLYETPEQLYITPRNSPEQALVISRQQQTLNVTINSAFSKLACLSGSQINESYIYGIFGFKQLVHGSYLIVVTKASKVG